VRQLTAWFTCLSRTIRGRLASAETRHEGKGGFVVDDDLKKKLMARRQWEVSCQ
jgi:hypothetical protein